ncbi:MAG: hypothetical protein HY283_10430 [Nitrospirae bacterium]|nr:hypothetical protein [Nitrospirota bacterium]
MDMKFVKILFVVICVGLATAGTASAENSLKSGAKGLSFGIKDNNGIEISGRLFVNNDVAVLAGVGLDHKTNDETTTDYSLSGGVRKYLGKADLAPFFGVNASFSRREVIVAAFPAGTDVESERTFGLDGVFGLEYFFARQVSAEAQVGVELSSIHNVNGSGADVTEFGTFSSGVTVNFYFP